MVDEQTIAQFIVDNPEIGRNKLAKKFGISVSQAQWRIRKYRLGIKKKIPRKIDREKKLRGIIPAQEFIDSHDVVKIVRDALPQLEGGVISDSDFRASLGISTVDWARIRELEEFEDNIKHVKGKLYWAMPETFAKLQKVMDIL